MHPIRGRPRRGLTCRGDAPSTSRGRAAGPTGAVGSGTDPVATTAADDRHYEVAAVSVQRRDGYLVGTLSVTRTH